MTMSQNIQDIKSIPTDPPTLAKYGIALIVNNRVTEAEELFRTNTESIQMAAGYAFLAFMDAVMSFEEEKLNLALNILQETEKKVATDIGWLKSVKNKVMGSKTANLAERLEMQIILADIQVFVSILTFLQQEFRGFIKGGWVLRKAWKIYQRTYLEVVTLYKQKIGDFNLPEPTDFEWVNRSSSPTPSPNASPRSSKVDSEIEQLEEWVIPESDPSKRNGASNEIDPETVSRLMGAVCFGYGLLTLGISLLPPSMLKISNFLGFTANRAAGISNLMYARKGTDMRAPLATLALLWYHTIVRPFYALDGTNFKAGIESATLLVREAQQEYEHSALVLFFKGRIHRLDSNIPMALESFQAAVNNSTQREIKLLSLHEVGWCYVIQLDYTEAQKVFAKLKIGSRWSKPFYYYLSIICSGSAGAREFSEIQQLREFYQNAVKINHLDLFIQRRLRIFPESEELFKQTDDIYWILFVHELIYLWNALPSCSFGVLDRIIIDCNQIKEEPMPGLAKLIEGECFNIIGNYDRAVENLRRCVEIRSKITPKDDVHISAYGECSLGVLLTKKTETKEEGKMMLQHCSQYKDYDFDNKLLVRINMALKNVS